jgi:hypothetical protein
MTGRIMERALVTISSQKLARELKHKPAPETTATARRGPCATRKEIPIDNKSLIILSLKYRPRHTGHGHARQYHRLVKKA